MKLENLASNIVNFSIGLTTISSICVFIPNPNIKQVAAFGVGLGFSGIAATQTITSKAGKEIDRIIKTSQMEIEETKNALNTASNLLTQKHKELNQATEINQKLIAEIKTLIDTQTARTLEVEALRAKVEDLSNRLIQAGKFTKDEAINLVTGTFDNSIKKLDALLNALQRNHPAIADSFNDLRVEIEKFKNYYLTQLESYQGLTDLQELLDTGLILQEKIIEKSCSLKLKAQTMVIWHLNEKISNSVSFEEYERNLQQLGEKAANEIRQRELDKQAIAQEWVDSNEQTVYNYETNFAEVMNIAKYSAHKQQELIAQIEKLEAEVAELSKPRLFYGGNNIAVCGNDIINYYYSRYHYRLDGINWQETETGYTLLFSIRNNPGVTINELQADNSKEQLAAFTNALHGTLPTWDFNYQHCLLTLTVVLRKLVKKDTSKEEIDKLWIPVSKFEKTVSKWERIRITAGSTGGKSPTAKNLALAIMKSRKGSEIKLYDPQHGSKKDYWDMPKAGTSHSDNVKGMEELCSELDRRSKTPGDHPFVLYIFDEIDSTIAQERANNDYYFFRDKVTYSLKQASHQNIGAIYIGQAADASTIPGMSWTDWNSAVQLHIGANAGNWLDKAKMIPSEEKEVLLKKYRKIQEYCDRKNEELGLDIFTDAGAYRFALVVPLSGLPQFMQLPAFDSYEYQEVMNNQEPMPVVQFTEIKEETKAELSCPHCGSLNIYKKGTNRKKEQLYECKDCSKTPKRFIPNIISKKIEK